MVMKRKAFATVIIVPIIRSKMMNPRIPSPRSGVLLVGCPLALADSVEFIAKTTFFRAVSEFLCVGKFCKRLWQRI